MKRLCTIALIVLCGCAEPQERNSSTTFVSLEGAPLDKLQAAEYFQDVCANPFPNFKASEQGMSGSEFVRLDGASIYTHPKWSAAFSFSTTESEEHCALLFTSNSPPKELGSMMGLVAANKLAEMGGDKAELGLDPNSGFVRVPMTDDWEFRLVPSPHSQTTYTASIARTE